MKKHLFPLLSALLWTASTISVLAQGKIAVQSGSNVTFFDQNNLQAALDAAQNGDVIHLPGGTFSGNITLDRSVQLIGAGYFPDSSAATTPTTLTGTFYITANVSNSYITGINFAGNVIAPVGTNPVITNLVVHRCQLQSAFGSNGTWSFSNNSSGIILAECVLASVYFNGALNCHIRNCIVSAGVSEGRNASIQNCIFLSTSISNCANCTVQGCIFYYSALLMSGTSTSYLTASRNCFVDADPNFTYVSAHNNVVGAVAADLFESYVPSFDYTDDFHLADNSPAIGAGPAGNDCGVYGGPSPWKEGGVPYNPHIQEQFIGTATNVQGELPVQIKVAAQGN